MQHRRPRLMAKILAFVLAVSLVFPVSAFASVADLADDTRAPGKSLANTYPNLPVDWQVSLAEDTKDVTVKVPVSLTADELTAAIEAQSISFSLVRDGERQYLNPEQFSGSPRTPRRPSRCLTSRRWSSRPTTTVRCI